MKRDPIPVRTTVAALLLALLAAAPAWAQASKKAQPRARSQATTSLARYVPRQDLAVYLEFAGLDARQAQWRKSAAYKLLNETTLGAMAEDLIRQAIDKIAAETRGDDKPSGEQVVAFLKHVARNGIAFGAVGKEHKELSVLVVRNADRKDVRAVLDKLLASRGGAVAKPTKVKKGRRELSRLQDATWWFENGDLVYVSPGEKAADAVLAVLDGKAPNAVNHTIRAELVKAEDGFEPVALGFVDIAALPPMPPDAAKLGLDGVKRVDLRWGFQDDAMMSVVRVLAPSPRRGIPALFDQPTMDLKSLPPIPAGTHGFTVLSVDMAKTYDAIVAMMKESNPSGAEKVAGVDQVIRERTGLGLRAGWLAHLGPKLAFVVKPAAQANAFGPMAAVPGEITILAQSDDSGALAKGFERLIPLLNDALANGGGPQAANRPKIRLEKINGPFRAGYAAAIPPGLLPPGPFAALKPTLVLGDKYLALSTTTDAATKAVGLEAGGATWAPGADSKAMANRLPSKFLMLNVNDPRDTLPTMVQAVPMLLQTIQGAAAQSRARAGQGGPPPGPPIAIDPGRVPRPQDLAVRLFPGSVALTTDDKGIRLVTRDSVPSLGSPAGAGVMVGLLLPAVQAAREAARRTQCMNNLKQIGLAFHNYHSANDAFPPVAITDKAGKKQLLSWRVAILPYIEEKELYDQFHLDEAWDSPHNKALIARMPRSYRCPSDNKAKEGETNYRVYSGPGAAFEGNKGLGIAQFTDGTANTILVVETDEAVPWTRPESLPFDSGNPRPPALPVSKHPGGFDALFADGSVRFIKKTIDPETYKKLLSRNGGEIIPADKAP